MNDIWKRKQELPVLECRMADGVPYLSFPMLEKTGIVRHGFSTRMGGVSTGVYATMNFAFLKRREWYCPGRLTRPTSAG